MYHPDRWVGWVPVRKAAHTTLSIVLARSGFLGVEAGAPVPLGVDWGILLRDPFERYVSSLCQAVDQNIVPTIATRTYAEAVRSWNAEHAPTIWTGQLEQHFHRQIPDPLSPKVHRFALERDGIAGLLGWLGVDSPTVGHARERDPFTRDIVRSVLRPDAGQVRAYYADDQRAWETA